MAKLQEPSCELLSEDLAGRFQKSCTVVSVPTLSAVSHGLVCSVPRVLDLPLRSEPAQHGTKPGSSLVNAEMRSFKG